MPGEDNLEEGTLKFSSENKEEQARGRESLAGVKAKETDRWGPDVQAMWEGAGVLFSV